VSGLDVRNMKRAILIVSLLLVACFLIIVGYIIGSESAMRQSRAQNAVDIMMYSAIFEAIRKDEDAKAKAIASGSASGHLLTLQLKQEKGLMQTLVWLQSPFAFDADAIVQRDLQYAYSIFSEDPSVLLPDAWTYLEGAASDEETDN